MALNAFEDLDYYAIDNLPIKLFEKFVELFLTSNTEVSKIALVMDLRDSAFVANYPVVFRKALSMLKGAEILFLEASDEVLIRRFSETRRKHPLAPQNITEGIQKERKLLADLKDLASTIVDTSEMDVHTLKKRIASQFAAPGSHQMQIRIVSFGFKYGIPKNCDLIFDVRFLSNPHFVPELRDFTGLDQQVKDFVQKDPRAKEFISKTIEYLEFLIPHYASEGKSYLSIGIGCTGGKHRSVFMASALSERLNAEIKKLYPLTVEHQDLRSE
ncbi:MAG: putative P-loop ATPase protein [Bacteriovoracaceae bacterium]|nr:putative P-loop ATPase protein [Bacteriovoracaceae bacterium]